MQKSSSTAAAVITNDIFPSAVCPEFTVDGSEQGSWADQDVGETVTISCKDTHKLFGESTLTCMADGTWSSDAPTCKLGESVATAKIL